MNFLFPEDEDKADDDCESVMEAGRRIRSVEK